MDGRLAGGLEGGGEEEEEEEEEEGVSSGPRSTLTGIVMPETVAGQPCLSEWCH